MDFSIQTVCVYRPFWLRGLALAAAVAGVVMLFQFAFGIQRRLSRSATGRPRGISVVHRLACGLAIALAFGSTVYFVGGLRMLRDYESTTGRRAPGVRSAIGTEFGMELGFAAVVLFL